MRKGWFKIPGVQEGDRSADEQLLGLDAALAECADRTVLDLGAAEGLISAAFARAGASRVMALEMVADHCMAARAVCRGLPVEVIQTELAEWINNHPQPQQFDIVLALGIAHKLHDPGACITFAARSSRDLLVFRGPGKAGMYWDGILKAKFGSGSCHVPTILNAEGFEEGVTLDSAHGERAQYWRRRQG